MTRPTSAKSTTRSREEGSSRTIHINASSGDVTYENVLVQHYLDALQNTPSKYSTATGSSPKHKFVEHHALPRNRPLSAYSIATSDSSIRRGRPLSAPAHRRPLSSTYGVRPTSAKSTAYIKVKSLYKKRSFPIVCTAFKNGDRSVFCRVTAQNLSMLLDLCTEKLGFISAARRAFYSDGVEITKIDPIERDAEVYISMGENFKDPFSGAKRSVKLANKVNWTVGGVVQTGQIKKQFTRPRISKRMRKMLESNKRRILVFKNGKGTEGVEIVADAQRFEEFLTACTAKLDLRGFAKTLFDWEGSELLGFWNVPILDPCLQSSTTPVLGPVWIGTGEPFSPKGVVEFLEGLIAYTKTKLKEAKIYKNQLQMAQAALKEKDENERERIRTSINITTILSMDIKQIKSTSQIVAKDLDDFTHALNHLKEQMDKLQELLNEEKELKADYSQQHIPKMTSDNRLIKSHNLRLKVYMNGTYDEPTFVFFNIQLNERGLKNDKDKERKLLEKLLDSCGEQFGTNGSRKLPKKLFDISGKELVNVYKLEQDQEVWLSYDDHFKSFHTYAITAQIDKVRCYKDLDGKLFGIREQIMKPDVEGKNKNYWSTHDGFGEQFDIVNLTSVDDFTRDIIRSQADSSKLPPEITFLSDKTDPTLNLYPEVGADIKNSGDNIYPPEPQLWVLSKDGYIHCKSLPQLVLGATDYKVATTLRHPTDGETDINVSGYVVTLQAKQNGNANQIWNFTKEGFINAESQPALPLTYIGSKMNEEEEGFVNQENSLPPGVNIFLAVCERIEDHKWVKAQRFAFKQEKLENLGQWKHTRVQNMEWSRRALSWPVDEEGKKNERYNWPMEGSIITYAPPIYKKQSSAPATIPPLRLLTLKNGVRDIRQAVSVVGPDLNNMKKDLSRGKHKNKKETMGDEDDHTSDESLSILKLEFILFLESATSLLNLPFAGRRLFDENGEEHHNLKNLKRDQLVYISCGEPWSNPNMTKSEQQRRYLLSNLGSDIARIKQFVHLRDGGDLVLEAEYLRPGAKIIINGIIENGPESEDDLDEQNAFDGDNITFPESLSSHDRAHVNSEEWLNKRKWPWERQSNGIDEVKAANQTNTKKFKRKKRKDPSGNAESLQKFYFDDEYIVARSNSDLVLGVEESEGRTRSVVLMKRKIDDIFQRWAIKENGFISAKFNSSMVLSVSMPAALVNGEENVQYSYAKNQVVVSPKKTIQFGRANQKWKIDAENNLIVGFSTTKEDMEITAANCANVCTAVVLGNIDIDQQGYEVDIVNNSKKPLRVCISCARSLRGRYKMEKIQKNVDFSCDLAIAKELGIKQVGSFKCIMEKIDLSTHEAENSLFEWTENFEKMKQELSVRSLAQSLNAARSPYTVKILAYKNGEGRLKPPILIIGSSIRGLLDQATHRLDLGWRANRLYTADGNLYLDIDSLIEGVRDQYVEEAKQHLMLEKEKEDQKNDLEEGSKEKYYGHAVLSNRAMTDNWLSTIVIPNPDSQAVKSPCTLLSWNYYAAKPGTLFLQIWRPVPEDNVRSKFAYSLVVQVQQEVPEMGEYELDATQIEEWQQSGGIHLEPGFVFGFYCPADIILNYDLNESIEESPLCCQFNNESMNGSTFFKRLPLGKERNYSMRVKVSVDNPTSPEPKKEPAQEKFPTEIQKPPIDMILPYPIEAWFSCGEPFVKPEKVEMRHSVQLKDRDERSNVSFELEKEKHKLRQMQGRRMEGLHSGTYRSNHNAERPVLVDGNWMIPTIEEKIIHDKVHQLSTHLSEMKDIQQSRKKNRKIKSVRLYTEPSLKRILVYPNGESIHRSVYIWGDSLDQLLDHATTRLNLNKASKYIFTVEGKLILNANELEKDQLVCVSHSKQFMKPKEYEEYIEMKARWGRDWKKYGSQVTDLVVTAKKSDKVDVDPFAPAKTGNKSSSKKRTNTQKK